MENKVIGKWVSDPNHQNKPNWATKKTPKGWSDSKGGSKGSQSFVGIDKRLSESLGFDVKINTEERIPIILGKVTEKQAKILKNASKEQIDDLYNSSKHSMRIDLVIQAKDKEDFPFPIFIEVDGSQHESNNVRNNSSENHLDRVKDFCCRLNKKGIMIRVKSNENSSKKVEFIIGELKRYYDMMSSNAPAMVKREKLQRYADAMCFMFAKNTSKHNLDITQDPEKYIKQTQSDIIYQIRRSKIKNKGFNPEELKLLNIWVRDRKDLSEFIKIFKSIEGEKTIATPEIYQGEYYKPYTFMEEIMSYINFRCRK